MPKYAKFAALIAIIVGSLVLVATASLKDSQTYYVTIPELHKMASATLAPSACASAATCRRTPSFMCGPI